MQKSRVPSAFFVLVFALSVPFWLVDASKWLPVSALAAVCPVTAASIFAYRRAGFAGVWGLLTRAIDFRRIPAVWYAPALVLSPALMLVSYGVQRLSEPTLPRPGTPPLAAFAMLCAFFLAASSEELGWSGLRPRAAAGTLERARATALVIGGLWAIWHVVPLLQAGRSLGWIA